MPDPTASSRLKELRAVFPVNAREVLTLELRQRPFDAYDQLDIVFVLDTTSTMSSWKTVLYDALNGLTSEINEDFTSIRAALVTFKDEDATIVAVNFTTVSAIRGAIGEASVLGGGDTPDNGYGALRMAARDMEWRDDAARVVVLWTDSDSHTRDSSYLRAKLALNVEEVVVLYGGGTTSANYAALATQTNGKRLTGTTGTTVKSQLASALNDIANPVADPIYLVYDTRNFTATLENGATKTFLKRSFMIDPFASGEDGTLGIPLSVDNTDLAVSRYIANAKKFNYPLDVVIRIYDSSNPTEPLNSPVLRLFASEFEITGSVVNCRLTSLDLQNAAFPNKTYSPEIAPSLQ